MLSLKKIYRKHNGLLFLIISTMQFKAINCKNLDTAGLPFYGLFWMHQLRPQYAQLQTGGADPPRRGRESRSAWPHPPTLLPELLWRGAVFVERRYPLRWVCLGRESPPESCPALRGSQGSRGGGRLGSAVSRLCFPQDGNTAQVGARAAASSSSRFLRRYEAITEGRKR